MCFNWRNVPFEIEWTRSWASELTWRLIVSEVTWCVSFVERSKRRNSVNTFGIDSKRFCKLSTVGGHGKLSAVSMYSSIKFCKIPAAYFTTEVSFNVLYEFRDFIPVVTSRQEYLLTITWQSLCWTVKNSIFSKFWFSHLLRTFRVSIFLTFSPF